MTRAGRSTTAIDNLGIVRKQTIHMNIILSDNQIEKSKDNKWDTCCRLAGYHFCVFLIGQASW